jgi:hypothetical protein
MTGLASNGPARCYERHGPPVARTITHAAEVSLPFAASLFQLKEW